MQYPEIPEEAHYESLMDLCFYIHKKQIISPFLSHSCFIFITPFQRHSYYTVGKKIHEGIQISGFKARFSSEHYDTHLMRRKHQIAAH